MRENLACALAQAGLPAYTASFGLADTSVENAFEAVLALADGALLRAKEQGRDRIVLCDAWPSESERQRQRMGPAEEGLASEEEDAGQHRRLSVA